MNRKTKWSHRLLALAMAAMMCCSVFPVGAFAETPLPQESMVVAEEQQTDETETDSGQTDASSPDPGADTEEAPVSSEVQNEECPEEEPHAEDAESMIEQPAQEAAQEPAEENEPYTFDGEILYADMPDAPTGSYLGSYGLPVATGETKIGLLAGSQTMSAVLGVATDTIRELPGGAETDLSSMPVWNSGIRTSTGHP